MKKVKNRKFIYAIFVTFSLVLFLGTSYVVKASELITYDANTFDTFKNRTKEEIAGEYSNVKNDFGTYRSGTSSTYYSESASVKSPYAAGKLTDDTHRAMTNYYRWLEVE